MREDRVPVQYDDAKQREGEKKNARRGWRRASEMERDKRLELSTYTLARYRSTN